jgi:mRNA interferase MazF
MMRRGDVVIIAQRGVYSGKPRPAVVIQAVSLEHHPSVLVCLMVDSEEAGSAPFRIAIDPEPGNGLNKPSLIQADRIMTIRRENIGRTIGSLDMATLGKLNTALGLFLGLG